MRKGQLCDSFTDPMGGGGGCGPPSTKDIQLALAGMDNSDPLLTLSAPGDTETAFVETADGQSLRVTLYDAPPELGLPLKFGLYFELPKDAGRVVAKDESGKVIASEDLDFLVEFAPESGIADSSERRSWRHRRGAVVANDRNPGNRLHSLRVAWIGE